MLLPLSFAQKGGTSLRATQVTAAPASAQAPFCQRLVPGVTVYPHPRLRPGNTAWETVETILFPFVASSPAASLHPPRATRYDLPLAAKRIQTLDFVFFS